MSGATAEILKVCENLSPERQRELADFAAFLLTRESPGDEAWERIIADPKPRQKLIDYEKASGKEGAEPLDLSKM